jgi:CPA2 family monovalent cation:H+ antiporter-2
MEHHLPYLITDLALILGAALLATLIFKRLKQPLVLGYIIAGLLVGPEINFIPTVVDQASIKIWAQIGVIFLLFSLGLEFSFKKLMRVGGTASITALVEIIVIVLGGFLVGRWLGWSTIDSIFLGGMLASSSTTIIIRAFDELGVKTRQFAKIVFGVLIVEDIVVILILVLLPTIAISQQIEGGELFGTLFKLIFFLLLWFILGIFLLPTFLKKAKELLDDEMLLLLSIALCLAMVVLATEVGFSAELGAFIMGSIFAETTKAEKIEHILKSVKDLFAAVFFVSVGMMIDLNAIWEHRVSVIVITLLTVFGKFISTTIGALMSGQPLKQSVQVGMSMAQIGEFAFIIATLGLTLRVTSDFLFPVAVGVSAITTFTTPYMIKYSEPFYNRLIKFFPRKMIDRINRYSTNTQNMQATSEWKVALKAYVIVVAVNGVLVLAIGLIALNFLLPFLYQHIANPDLGKTLFLFITFLMALPFLWAMAAKQPNNWAYKELWVNKKFNRGPLIMVEIVRVSLAILLVGFLLDRTFSGWVTFLIVIAIIAIVVFFFSRRIQRFHYRMESRFITNLHAREDAITAREPHQIQTNMDSSLMAWDAHLADFTVHPQSQFLGQSLQQLAWREHFGINIALIRRGEQIIYAPGRNEILYPYDKISIIGTDEQIQNIRPLLEQVTEEDAASNGNDIVLQKIIVDEHNRLKGLSILESGIREKTDGLIVGIERDEERILNPYSSEKLQWNDIIWIVGNRKKIQALSATPRKGG